MDLLTENPSLNLNDNQWRIYSTNTNHPPQFVGSEAKIKQSVINEGSIIYGEVNHSVLFYGVNVGEGSKINNSVIMPNVKIGTNVEINNAIIGEEVVIPDNSKIGEKNGEITLFEEDATY